MASASSDYGGGALVPISPESQVAAVYPLHHGLKYPISRLSISWSRGNSLRVSVFASPPSGDSVEDDAGGKVVEVKLGGDGEISDAHWRRIAYDSVSPFALLQSRKNAVSSLSKMSMNSPYDADWWDYIMEYSKDINALLGSQISASVPLIDDPKSVINKGEEPTSLKAAWELLEMFYAENPSHSWLPERFVDWLADYDSLFSGTHPTVHSKLVDFQKDLVNLQVVEDDPKYWEVISSALAVGWLDIVVKMLRLHGSYRFDQLSNRETENGLVEAVAVLISKMPRMRLDQEAGKLGECFKAKPDFVKAWEKWRGQISKLDSSAFWFQCAHQQTREGLRTVYFSLAIHRPLTVGLESMYGLAQKSIQLKPMASAHRLMGLIIGIIGENTEVVLAECSKGFGPWMVAHAMELLTARSDHAEMLLHEERQNLGGISIEELHRLIYAQVLSSHPLTWQIAPIYLISCMKHGMVLLQILLSKQPVQDNQLMLKSIEICRLYELRSITSNIMKIAGVHHWKHGRKGCGVFWLQQARDEYRLNRIAQQLFDSVGKSISDESFKQWEGLIQLLGSDSKTAGGLEFLHKNHFCMFMMEKTTDAARQAVESLISLMKNPSTPQRFYLPLLYDSLKLLNWKDRPLLNVSQTNLLLTKLQDCLWQGFGRIS
ncbi:Nuclear pore complex protein NUP85 [Hibiscus syriacus]|uniref:Nuclear pore complex protein Nup85 n=1 Tax=Hibiscus syriacus TaxID=106335 RepID=A0A6A2ZR62_HIBSY|nr:Nuclear pore complex protein NUP85 [Hibiscus syriacus]